MSRQALIAIIIWKFWVDYHLKLSPVRELGFIHFLTIITTKVKTDALSINNSSILIKESNWDLEMMLAQLK